MENTRIEALFGTLQQSVLITWRMHLKSNIHSHAEHIILQDYYEGLPDILDTLIENYIAVFGQIDGYCNCIEEISCPIEYLEQLRKFTKESRYLLKGETELESDLDAILSFIDTTLYKLKNLIPGEHYSLSDYTKDRICKCEPDYDEVPTISIGGIQ